ncbi:hypothetical protein H4R21_004215 [Coemansia helicoidea]|uniref:Uncharacterized protein n=1 Tax=Coemansia helicoidea TaxID=1286919 RepID=A0ACC1KZ36_9FUNG|nr:hypothetical protein H4R21_004215 [Coemansia helicoidea]
MRVSSDSGPLVPDPLMPIEECTERIERLLHRVKQTQLECAVQQALNAPQPPTRFAEQLPRPQAPPAAAARSESPGSTASTASLRSASSVQSDAGLHIASSGLAVGGQAPYSPRRRAVTLGPSVAKRSSDERLAGLGQAATPTHKTPIEEMRAKIQRVRARRAERLREEQASLSPPSGGGRPAALTRMHSEISGTTYYASDDDEVSGDFFENKENLALFREAQMPARDIDWDKRVYYHHVARTNDDFRSATQDVEIADCRDACFVELVGRKTAARIARAHRPEPRRRALPESPLRLDDADAAAVSAWIDEDSDDSGGEADRSFDWSRHGFGYMEFRRRSLASSAILSPGATPEPPSLPPHLPPPDDPAASLMAGAKSGRTWSITSSTARAATDNFNQAVAAASAAAAAGAGGGTTGAWPASDARFCPQHVALLSESEDSDADDDWDMLDSEDVEARQAAQLESLRRENADLQRAVERSRRAVFALARVVLGPL